jgi:hypothetical protein
LDQLDVLKDNKYVMKVWKLFKKDYDKSYSTEEEEKERLGKFIDNLKLIIQENFQFDKGLKSFTLQINQFADMSLDEFLQKLTGLNSDAKGEKPPGEYIDEETNRRTERSLVSLTDNKAKNRTNTRTASENLRLFKPGANRRLFHKTTHKPTKPYPRRTTRRPTRPHSRLTTRRPTRPHHRRTTRRPTRPHLRLTTRKPPKRTTKRPIPVAIKAAVDYRRYMNPIENQGTCGLVCFFINKLLFLTICPF